MCLGRFDFCVRLLCSSLSAGSTVLSARQTVAAAFEHDCCLSTRGVKSCCFAAALFAFAFAFAFADAAAADDFVLAFAFAGATTDFVALDDDAAAAADDDDG